MPVMIIFEFPIFTRHLFSPQFLPNQCKGEAPPPPEEEEEEAPLLRHMKL